MYSGREGQVSGKRNSMKSSEISLGSRALDPVRRTLKDSSGREIELRYQSMSVLVALASRAGEDISRQDIIDAVWSGKHVSDDSLTQCIADIRKALGDDDRKILETVPRVGYRLVVSEKASGSKRLRAVPALLAALVAIIAGAAFLYRYGSPKTPVFPVVAILPMDDLSTADHAGYLGDALSEGIITELARFPQFKVIARNSSFQFRGMPTDIREIGEILGADYVVEGSQQYDGGNLRISIQLVETGSGTHVYSGRFDRRLDDLFDVQDEIVARVAATVGGSVMTHVPNRRSAGEVTAVLRGLQARKLMRNPTRENWRKALALEEASIREDPDSPWGYIGKSLMLVNGVFQGWLERPREAVFAEATDYAQKALDIAPDNYMSQYAMARVLTSRKEYPESILHFQRASELKSFRFHGSRRHVAAASLHRRHRARDLDPAACEVGRSPAWRLAAMAIGLGLLAERRM